MTAAQVQAAGRGRGRKGGTRFVAPPRGIDAQADSPIKLPLRKEAVPQKTNQNRSRESKKSGLKSIHAEKGEKRESKHAAS